MSSPATKFLSLAPATHEAAVIVSAFSTPVVGDSVIPVQKTRRSSSTATAESDSGAKLVSPTDSVVDPLAEDVVPVEAAGTQFLRLGH